VALAEFEGKPPDADGYCCAVQGIHPESVKFYFLLCFCRIEKTVHLGSACEIRVFHVTKHKPKM